MKYHYCKTKHNPPDSYGDCLRACVASLLDMENIEDVPHFVRDGCDGETAFGRVKDWLQSQGYAPFFSIFSGAEPFETIAEIMELYNPGVRYILFGNTGNNDHAAVYVGGQLSHDPAWSRGPFLGPGSNGNWLTMTVVPMVVCE